MWHYKVSCSTALYLNTTIKCSFMTFIYQVTVRSGKVRDFLCRAGPVRKYVFELFTNVKRQKKFYRLNFYQNNIP